MGLSLETPAPALTPPANLFSSGGTFSGAAEFQHNGPAAEDPGTQFTSSFN